MGARIEAMAVVRSRGWPPRRALHLEEQAARVCLERAGRRPEEVDLLVNAGIYKDDNTAEPALASIIQEDIGANPGHPPERGRHGTFSFDVTNGGAGALTALELVDGFLGSDAARLGLIVAGDAAPSRQASNDFPFTGAAGAILLGHTAGEEGFHRFAFRTFPSFARLFEARLEWDGDFRRNVLRIGVHADFADACVECAVGATAELLDSARLLPADIDVLATSQYPEGFPERLALATGVARERLPVVAPELARTHTAGVIAALQASVESGAFARARNVLLVAVAAGITVGLALYRR
jgi:3-oxoacyl-[acyl-carrier-protein] synthase-3